MFGACSIRAAAHASCVCRAACSFCPTQGACSGHGRCAGQCLAHACARVCVCVASVTHADPFLTTSFIWNLASTSRIASTPCPCKSRPAQAASVEGLAAWSPHPSAKPLSRSPSCPAVNQPPGRATLRTLRTHRRPWQSLCPPSPSGLPFAGGSQVTLPIPVSERTHLCLRGLFWIPGKL